MTDTFRKWHRKLREDCIEAYGGGSNLLRELRKQGSPLGYRALCYNCNASFGMYGYCPHHPEKSLVDRALDELPFLT
jgi:hypothetical protein